MRLRGSWAHRLTLLWHRVDAAAWSFAALAGTLVAGLAWALGTVILDREARRERQLQVQQQSLECLARNVYFEARGEPLAGQYAVAEVTMNRTAAPVFRRSVCDVVYEKAAFSWTLERELPQPAGREWDRARKVAEAVYFGRHAPLTNGARFYHATYVNPAWARDKQRVARIGRHIFYR